MFDLYFFIGLATVIFFLLIGTAVINYFLKPSKENSNVHFEYIWSIFFEQRLGGILQALRFIPSRTSIVVLLIIARVFFLIVYN